MYFEIYPSYVGNVKQWRWRLKAANHLIIANSGESYFNAKDCGHAIGLVMSTSIKTPIKEVLN
jgi:uncharacterized protein